MAPVFNQLSASCGMCHICKYPKGPHGINVDLYWEGAAKHGVNLYLGWLATALTASIYNLQSQNSKPYMHGRTVQLSFYFFSCLWMYLCIAASAKLNYEYVCG